MSLQKVENALKRANELQNGGSQHEALQILYETIMNSRFRAQGWDIIKEHVMIKFINFCVEMDKLKYVRDGLYQYRTISHQLNIPSLGKVITELRDKAEEKFRLAKLQHGDRDSQSVADLEAEESPEDLMLNTIQVEVRDSTGRNFHNSLRFLWETYKLIMDILKFSPKLDTVYHDTARRACNFCFENQRPLEFKRLCDALGQNYTLILKYKNNKENETLLRPELNLETRLSQLNVATELGLWKEASTTAEDLCNLGIHDLFHKSFRYPNENSKLRERLLKWLAIYYEKLAKIFWVSENYLFHALAYIKYLLHIKHYKKNVGAEELQYLGSTAVLAVLSIPTVTEEKKMGIYSADGENIMESHKKMTNLLGHPNIPTRDSLKYIITHRDILEKSSDVCQDLFALVESDFLPLKLCSQCLPLLTTISNGPHTQYIAPIKKIIFHKLLVQLSKVFTSITIDYFTTRICPKEFYMWENAEYLIVNLVQQGHLRTLLDYEKGAIYFGSATVDPVMSMRYELSNLGKNLVKCVSMIYPGYNNKESLEKKQYFKGIHTELEYEHTRILMRKEENDKRRTEKIKALEQFEEHKKQEKLRLKQKEEERKQKQEQEEMQILENQRLQKQMHTLKVEIAAQLLEDIIRIRANLIVNGKPINEFTPEELLNAKFDLDDIEKVFEEQFIKERSEKLRLKRLDAKKMDHLHRAIRQEEMILLNNWKKEILDKDRQELEKLQAVRQVEYKKAYEESLKSKALLKGVVEDTQAWIDKHMVERQNEFEINSKEQIAKITEILKQKKIQRARDRLAQAEQAKKNEELKKKQEEEEQQQLAEQERLHKLDQMARIQRQKEQIELKVMGELIETSPHTPQTPNHTTTSPQSSSHHPTTPSTHPQTTTLTTNGAEHSVPTPPTRQRFVPSIIKREREAAIANEKLRRDSTSVREFTRRTAEPKTNGYKDDHEH